MGNLLRRLFGYNRGFLIACALVLAIFHFILCAIVDSVDIESALAELLAFAPPLLRTMFE